MSQSFTRWTLAAMLAWCSCPAAVIAQNKTGAQEKPHVVFVVGTHHYSPEKSMPVFAKRLESYGIRTTVLIPEGDPERNKNGTGIPGLEALDDADAVVFFMRFLALPEAQLKPIVDYVKSGKPAIGIRTATHAFAYPEGDKRAVWNNGFGRDVLGTKYFIHLQGATQVEHVLDHRSHLILNGVPAKFNDPGTLYKVELPDDATPILMGTGRSKKVGTVKNAFGTHELKPVNSWPVAWTWKNQWGGRVFGTTLGHPKSYETDAANRLLLNGIHWALGRTLGASFERKTVEEKNRSLKRPIDLSAGHDPEIERKSFHLLPGFECNLFAAEPMLVNPIHMTWDAQGRLWVACSTSYPQIKPGEDPDDQIIVLEDTDDDGRADKSTVFAGGLYVPTGLEMGDGGVYVANAPDLLFLKDTDGDLKADVREVVLTGFATEDNHHSISAWRWGPGGWLYFQEGTFMHSQVETPRGLVRLENGGVFQFRPREMDLRVYADYRASNPWGHMFDRWGQGVLIDNPRLFYEAPLTGNSRAKMPFDPSGTGTKQAGGEFTSGRHLPEEYRGQIFTNQYKTHIVTRYAVTDDQAGFSIKEQEPLIRSDSAYFRPVDLKMGPDGAVYILDWYNPLIGHMQHSFRDERRDSTHGRVWRVTYKGRPLVKKPKLIGVPLAEVVSHLRDPEDWTRYQVRRVLYNANPDDAAAAISSFATALDPAEAGYDHARMEALWAFQTIGKVNTHLLRDLLKAKHPLARSGALRVLRYWHAEFPDRLELLATAVQDEHPRVRLEAVLTAGFVPNPEAMKIAVRVIDRPMDRFLDHSLKLTVDGLTPHWLAAYKAGTLKFDTTDQQNYALSNVTSNESVTVLVDILNSANVTPQAVSGPVVAVAQSATARQLQPLSLTLFEYLRSYNNRLHTGDDTRALTMILDALDQAARQRGVRVVGGEGTVQRAIGVNNDHVRAAAARLAGSWRLKKVASQLQGLVNSERTASAVRQAAATSLGEIPGKGNTKFLKNLTKPSQPIDKRYLGVLGLASSLLKQAAPVAAEVLTVDPTNADPGPLVAAFVERKEGADLLGQALAAVTVHPLAAAKSMDYMIRVGQQHPGLVKAFGGEVAAGSLEGLLQQEDAKKLAREILAKGNAARGELIYRRAETSCMTCHGIGNAGNTLGPDLAAIGSSSPPDYIVDSLLRPSKVIKEFYETMIVLTDKGKVVTGILQVKSDEKIVLRDASSEGKEITILSEQVEDLKKGPSLMPTGLANKVRNRQEFLDLARFITELGRPGPYATSVAQVIRRWRVQHVDTAPDDVDWTSLGTLGESGMPAYTLVSGLLPAAEMTGTASQRTAVLAGQVDVTAGGLIGLKINSPVGLRVFVDGKPVSLEGDRAVRVRPGRLSLACVVDLRERGEEGLRVELVDVPGSSAAFKVVGGR
ncbi:MAG: dehydrogenase [Planctomycetaceae bacterium]|nr:dehydrogenase [Planctomycetaceae bacterium]